MYLNHPWILINFCILGSECLHLLLWFVEFRRRGSVWECLNHPWIYSRGPQVCLVTHVFIQLISAFLINVHLFDIHISLLNIHIRGLYNICVVQAPICDDGDIDVYRNLMIIFADYYILMIFAYYIGCWYLMMIFADYISWLHLPMIFVDDDSPTIFADDAN